MYHAKGMKYLYKGNENPDNVWFLVSLIKMSGSTCGDVKLGVGGKMGPQQVFIVECFRDILIVEK